MSSVIQRIKLIAEAENKSITAFEATVGASKGVFSRALSNGTDIQSKWLVQVIEKYPKYSSHWLLTGEGQMLRNPVIPYEISAKPTETTYTIEEKESLKYETTFKGLTSGEQLSMVKDLLETVLKAHTSDIDILKQEVVSLKAELLAIRNKIGD